MPVGAPELLGEHHILDRFDCGVASLDEWLRRRARPNHVAGASRTFVVAEDRVVVGYFSLASGSLSQIDAPGAFRRNMPEPIPAAVLARLAVTRGYQGRGLGAALVRDAFQRVLAAGEIIGVRGMVVHAIDETARDFYLSIGFQPSITQPMTLIIALDRIRRCL